MMPRWRASISHDATGKFSSRCPLPERSSPAVLIANPSPARVPSSFHPRRRQGWKLEGTRAGEGFAMSTAGELRSGKGHRDENFPVASWLIDARHRGIILAFYEFVRVADDIADHATLAPD